MPAIENDLRGRIAHAVGRAGEAVATHITEGSLLHRGLRSVRRRLPREPPPDPIGRAIFEFARGRRSAFFIQIGANDGIQRDQLRTEVMARQWSGILVEPVPYVFERLRRNCIAQPRLTLDNVAISDHVGFQELYYLPQSDDEGLPQWYDALASFNRDVVLKHREYIPDIEARIASMNVPCVTFSGLCERHNVDHVDLIQIDTEGYDFEIIKLIDFDRYRPAVLMFEHHHLDPRARSACAEYLRARGFEGLSHSLDTLCIRRRELTENDRHLTTVWEKLRRMPDVEEL